jgi:hypothetical protein
LFLLFNSRFQNSFIWILFLLSLGKKIRVILLGFDSNLLQRTILSFSFLFVDVAWSKQATLTSFL